MEITDDIIKQALILKSHKMKRETWIRNVMKTYPEKSQKETEAFHDKIFNSRSPYDSGTQSDNQELSKDETTREN